VASLGQHTIQVKVEVTWETVQKSPELQNLLREMIREELENLPPSAIRRLTRRITEEYEKNSSSI